MPGNALSAASVRQLQERGPFLGVLDMSYNRELLSVDGRPTAAALGRMGKSMHTLKLAGVGCILLWINDAGHRSYYC